MTVKDLKLDMRATSLHKIVHDPHSVLLGFTVRDPDEKPYYVNTNVSINQCKGSRWATVKLRYVHNHYLNEKEMEWLVEIEWTVISCQYTKEKST